MTTPQDLEKKKRRRLSNVDVTHVSLVDRPANRTPFRFIKTEDHTATEGAFPMHVSLKNMFGLSAAQVTSVIAKDEATVRKLAPILMEGDEATITEQDGLFVARKSGTKPNDRETVIHHGKSAGVAYTVENMVKGLSLYDAETTDFDEALRKNGFAPGVHVGVDALLQTIFNAAMSDDTSDPAAFKATVSKAVDQFGVYMGELIDALPATAFKFERGMMAGVTKALLAVRSPNKIGDGVPGSFDAEFYDSVFGDGEATTEAQDAASDAGTPAEGADASGEGNTPAGEDAAQTGSGEAQEAAKEGVHPAEHDADTPADSQPATVTDDDAAAEKDKAVAEAKDGEAVAKNDPPNLVPETKPAPPAVDLEAAMSAMMDKLTKAIGEAVAPITQRLDATDAAVQKVAKSMGETVLTEPDADSGNVVALSKGAQDASPGFSEPPLMDTGHRRVRKSAGADPRRVMTERQMQKG